MKAMIMPPSSQTDAIKDVYPVGGRDQKSQFATRNVV
jgi:hypothetical protein